MKIPFFKEHEQYIPTVTNKDIERIISRDYSEANYNKIKELIKNSYHETRVLAACLKNTAGVFEAFENEIKNTEIDCRDTLVDAEYPTYFKESYNNKKLSIKEKNQLIKEDKEKYLEWFN